MVIVLSSHYRPSWLTKQRHCYTIKLSLSRQSDRTRSLISRRKPRSHLRPESPRSPSWRLIHDAGRERHDLQWGFLMYLRNKSTELESSNGRRLKVYGSSWAAQYGTRAFQYLLSVIYMLELCLQLPTFF